ncbi:Detected protein of confused Function [Hibiscus syriacus]|uniref:Detected protein of confused Function n=1 Tax=Hibiscus syriacus TaxID=106335 RepID=A0A6A3D490_HIBSY|nr:Detected protein of confused Function [Hibiscus syriacus]
MANQGAKKRTEENARHMSNLRRLIVACNNWNMYKAMILMLIFHFSITWKHWVGLLLTSVAYFFPYQQLARMAKPSYADDGELLDDGFDMSVGGICGYLHDIIYITNFVQLASIISDKFWYTYLVVSSLYLVAHGNQSDTSILCSAFGIKAYNLERKYQHLEHINLSGSLVDFYHRAQRERWRMKRLERKGKRWRGRPQGHSLSRLEIDECFPKPSTSVENPEVAFKRTQLVQAQRFLVKTT